MPAGGPHLCARMVCMRQRLLPAVFLILLPSAGGAADLGEPVRLHVGETAEVAELKVTFSGVDGDNRCPRDVQCIVAGRARVVLEVDDGEGSPTRLQVDVPPGGEGKGRAGDYELVVDVEPETRAGVAIEPDDYVITFVAEAAEGPGEGDSR